MKIVPSSLFHLFLLSEVAFVPIPTAADTNAKTNAYFDTDTLSHYIINANGEAIQTVHPEGLFDGIKHIDYSDARNFHPWKGVQGLHGESSYDIAARERLAALAEERARNEAEVEAAAARDNAEGGVKRSLLKGSVKQEERVLAPPAGKGPGGGPPPAVIYDAIIVGAGPGGCSAAYTLVDEGVDPTKILVIERGPDLQTYKDRGYDLALNFRASQSDPDFREDVAGTPIVLGRGVGGGTNHFGMQFIDQPAVSDASSRQPVEGSDIEEEVTTFSTFSGASTYSDADYTTLGAKAAYDALYAKASEVMGANGTTYRNNVYKTAGDITNPPRLMVGDLIDAGTEVLHDTEVISLVPNTGYHCVETINNMTGTPTAETYCAEHILLAANPLNSARLALNAGVLPFTGRDKGKKYVDGLWDHQGSYLVFWPPGTQWIDVPPTPITDEARAGLTVYKNISEAEDAYPNGGLIGFVTVGVMTQAQVDSVLDGTWDADDPSGTDQLSYLFTLGDFFSSSHPGGDKSQQIIDNGYDISTTINTEAPDSHQDNRKISRILRAGGELIGILDRRTNTLLFSFANVDSEDLTNAWQIIAHMQMRPHHHKWQFYHTPQPSQDPFGNSGEIILAVILTGEQIQDDGRVYEGDAVTADTVKLPSFTEDEFLALKECAEVSNQVMSELGWTNYGGGPQYIPQTKEEMEGGGIFLRTTYHYHGMMCPHTTNLASGFHACDLSRMCRKWAGSTSAASGGMGVQCGREVAAELAARRKE